ncbi:ATPase [Stenotrophomonas phage Philippe]|uniref:AAA-ATPase n=1 Tax=Stenotrophomonas phage Philippe TaxID=2859655 RepID=A0AAE7WMJ8_9CAUD|nr:ATPase [Stenotrophomonas phage Philippe]QYW02239.1 AAA-ATPase [Stenotrophomonas phage Philippe]
MANGYSYKVNARQLTPLIIQAVGAGLVPFVQASPGVGKSSVMRAVADKYRLKMIDHRLAASMPEDFNGLPRFENGRAYFSPFSDLFPLEGDRLPGNVELTDGTFQEPTHEGWMLFLDEMNQASKAVQAASYKLILDKMVGQHRLHPKCVITAAGNLTTDRALASNLGTALQSRLIHFEMEVSHKVWLEDVAYANDYDFRVIAFLSQYPNKLMDFDPEHENKTFCCPRTWEFVNAMIKDQPVSDKITPLLAGTITEGVAVEFVQFCQVIDKMVKVTEVLAGPDSCRLPEGPSATWATVAALMENTTMENFDKVAKYAERLDMDFRLLYFRGAIFRNKLLASTPTFAQVRVRLAKYLTAD